MYAGTCYQATNWVEVGQTQGRGRQGAAWQKNKTIKTIYVYPLAADFRNLLGVVPPPLPPPLGVEDGVNGQEWAENEFGGAQIGDQRLSKRLVEAARMQATKPGHAFCAVAEGNTAVIILNAFFM